MAKKKKANSLFYFISLAVSVVLIVALFFPFVGFKTEGSVVGNKSESITNVGGFQLIGNLFTDEVNTDQEGNVLVQGYKSADKTAASMKIIMISALVTIILAVAILVLSLLGLLNKSKVAGITMIVSIAALVVALVGIFGGVTALGNAVSTSAGLGGLFEIKYSILVGSGLIIAAVASAANVVNYFVVKK